jgi:hypothetical protein
MQHLPDSVMSFFHRQTTDRFFTGPIWLDNFIKTILQEPVNLVFYCVEDEIPGQKIHCLFPARNPANKRGSILKYHGVGNRSLSGITSEKTIYYSPIFQADDPQLYDVFFCLADYISREQPAWQTIDFAALDMPDEPYLLFKRAFSKAGFLVGEYRSYSTWYGQAGDSFSHYLKELSKPNRKSVKNYLRKLKLLENKHDVQFRTYVTPKDTGPATQDYSAVLDKSWKNEDLAPMFVPGLIEAGMGTGQVKMMTLACDGRPVAIEVVILHENTAVLFRTAYDPDYAWFSVGSLVCLKMIEYLIDVCRVEVINFGRDDETYKKTWVPYQRYQKGMIAHNVKTLWGAYGFFRLKLTLFWEAVGSMVRAAGLRKSS